MATATETERTVTVLRSPARVACEFYVEVTKLRPIAWREPVKAVKLPPEVATALESLLIAANKWATSALADEIVNGA
jgi:hypothetical protein